LVTPGGCFSLSENTPQPVMRVHTIDLKFQNVPGVIAAYLVESGGELALIETGPGSTLAALHAGIIDA